MQQERIDTIAGLPTIVIGNPTECRTLVVLLHGYAMRAADLAPFPKAMRSSALFLLPQAPHPSPLGGYGWWDIDIDARANALQRGARDLAEEQPSGLAAAREQLDKFMTTARSAFSPQSVVLGGFSQGGMLACDYLLHQRSTAINGLFLLSASRLNIEQWRRHQARAQRLPVLISHGKTDADLSFAAGEALRDFFLAAEAHVSWVDFEQGHEIPFVVWRELRRFLKTYE